MELCTESQVDEKLNNQSQIIDDEKLQRQKEIDAWLPITGSRNAKWWYSAFHNVTAMVGAGVSSLPFAMSNLGWYVNFSHSSFSIVNFELNTL